MKLKQWLKALAAAFISGFVQSFLSICGITGANMVGLQIPQLTPKQLLVTSVFGGAVGAALYLKQSPVPADDGNPQPQVQIQPPTITK